jgi:hypothetical protein
MDEKTFDEQYKRGLAAGREARLTEPRATSVRYDRRDNRLEIALNNGVLLSVPCRLIQGLRDARPDDIARVKVRPRGGALFWDSLDVQMSVPGLLAGIFGTRAWMSALGRAGGRAKSEAKAAPVRESGREGGRPGKAARG